MAARIQPRISNACLALNNRADKQTNIWTHTLLLTASSLAHSGGSWSPDALCLKSTRIHSQSPLLTSHSTSTHTKLVQATSGRFLPAGATFSPVKANGYNQCWYSPFTVDPHRYLWVGYYYRVHACTLVCLNRAHLHYGGEVHRSVEKFSPKHGYLRRGMVCRRRWKDNKYFIQVGLLLRSRFLYEALRLLKKLKLHRTPLSKKVSMLASMSFFHPCTNVLHQRTWP